MQAVKKTVEIPHLQIVKKVVEIPEIQTVQGTQTSESLGSGLVRQVAQAEILEMAEIGALLPAVSAPLLFVTAPVLEAPPVVVKQVHPAPVVEYVTPASAVTYAQASPFVEYVTGDMLAFVLRQVEIGESLPTESASPMFVTASVL